jgi:hypothetical protein
MSALSGKRRGSLLAFPANIRECDWIGILVEDERTSNEEAIKDQALTKLVSIKSAWRYLGSTFARRFLRRFHTDFGASTPTRRLCAGPAANVHSVFVSEFRGKSCPKRATCNGTASWITADSGKPSRRLAGSQATLVILTMAATRPPLGITHFYPSEMRTLNQPPGSHMTYTQVLSSSFLPALPAMRLRPWIWLTVPRRTADTMVRRSYKDSCHNVYRRTV